jgi:ATP-binding cassette subfamily B protein
MRNRTSVIVAHRLSTIQRADNIIVLHHGEIREQGTHQDLLLLQGLYWRLYKLQYSDPSWLTETTDEEEEQITYRPRGPGFSFGEGMG